MQLPWPIWTSHELFLQAGRRRIATGSEYGRGQKRLKIGWKGEGWYEGRGSHHEFPMFFMFWIGAFCKVFRTVMLQMLICFLAECVRRGQWRCIRVCWHAVVFDLAYMQAVPFYIQRNVLQLCLACSCNSFALHTSFYNLDPTPRTCTLTPKP